MGTLRPGNFAYGLVVSLGAYFVKKIGALSRLADEKIWNVRQLRAHCDSRIPNVQSHERPA